MKRNAARTRKRANAPVSLINVLMVQSLHPAVVLVFLFVFLVLFWCNPHRLQRVHQRKAAAAHSSDVFECGSCGGCPREHLKQRHCLVDGGEVVALAASTLEGVFKAIIQDMDPNASVGNLSLSKLTSKVVKELVEACDPSTPQEVKTLAAQLRSLGSSIDNLRSDKSTAHGKAPGEYVVDDSLWAETVVNVWRHSEYSYGGSTNGTPGGNRNRQGRFRCTAGTSRSDGWPRTCASSGPMLRCC